MARRALTAVLIVLVCVLVGCRGVDTGASQLVPARTKATVVKMAGASESDMIEQVAINRQAYRGGLESLVAHYERTGNHMKLGWARDELEGLKEVHQYSYIVEAAVPPATLRAGPMIAEAELLYMSAMRYERKSKTLGIFPNEDKLRLALDKYNELIEKHPSSDKIDDAAYRAGRICEHFKDYTIALLYYQRAYQWDPQTVHPARYKAAYILDTIQHRRAEALKIYQQALRNNKLSPKQREFAQTRVRTLTKSGEKLK
ncbi:MAG: tetratricopeptide repeat protein [Planctomycetota bacterium]|jgi:tetratricopeptide (TPR) repeat protein